jgi:assimilatory nitrate reductase catalytic subunit
VKALWIACTNPAQSLPDQATVRRAFERAEFVLVQEAFEHTATAQYADVLLPATTWGEKDGTVTNSERRISRVRPAVAAPGQARHDWAIATDIARRLAAHIGPSTLNPTQRAAMFDYPTPEAVWNEHRESTRGRDLDITGLSYEILEQQGPQQWPMPEGAARGRERLYEDGIFPTVDGRARFADVAPQPLAEPRNAAYPFSLNTGRLRDQWHGMSRTGTLGRLFGHTPEPVVELHPQDLARLRVAEGEAVQLKSKRGQVVLTAKASTAVLPAQAFVPMHWGSETLVGRTADGALHGGVNELTTPVFCPKSKQPELKHSAVQVQKVVLPWRLAARVWLPSAQALRVRQKVLRLLGGEGYEALAMASVVPFGREGDEEIRTAGAAAIELSIDGGSIGLVLRAAAATPISLPTLAPVLKLLGLDAPDVLAYDDAGAGQQRRLKVRPGGTHLSGYWLAGDASGHEALDALVADGLALPGPARLLLAPGSLRQRLAEVKPRGPQVCSCFNVDEERITTELRGFQGDDAQRLGQLQKHLKCGTQCGSCLPRLRTLVRVTPFAGSGISTTASASANPVETAR